LIAGYYQTTLADLPRGFVRQADGTLVPFDVPGAAGTQLYGISNLGHIAGGYYDPDGTSHGFIYANGQFTTIDFTGPNTMIFGLNDLGQVVGASYPEGGFFTGPYSGFLATPVPEPSGVSLSAAAFGALLAYVGRRRRSGMQ
jgi:probable HAF family extracellular repeat protein